MENDNLISKAAAKEAIRKVISGGATELVRVWKEIDKLPIIDQSQCTGYWRKMAGMMPPEYHGHYECSECSWHLKGLRNSFNKEEEFSYCPNCGAKMEKSNKYESNERMV